MPYRYVAYAADNSIVQGTVAAASEAAAEEALTRAGYQPVMLRPHRAALDVSALFPSLFGVKRPEVVAFARHLAVLLRSGMPLVTALDGLKSQAGSKAMRRVVGAIAQDVRSGTPLSTALKAYPLAFPTLYTEMIAVGEQSGDIEGMLLQVSQYYKREQQLKRRIQGAMAYPMIIALMAVAVSAILVTFVLPNVLLLVQSLNMPVPLVTRLFLGAAAALSDYKFVLLGVIFIGGGGAALALRYPGPRFALHRLLLKLPLIGTMITYRELGRWARTASLLLRSGVSLPKILETTQRIAGNEAFRRLEAVMHRDAVTGRPVAETMSRSPLIPSAFAQMVRTGEMAGSLDTNLESMADLYDEELDTLLQRMVSLIEPIMTLAIGLVVGIMAVSIIMPIYQTIGNFSTS